jgi:hypothetical protein
MVDPDLDSQSRSGSRRAKISHKIEKDFLKVISEVLDVHLLGLKASPVCNESVSTTLSKCVFGAAFTT